MGRLSIFSLFFFTIIHGANLLMPKEMALYWRDYNGTIPLDALPTDYGTYFGQVTVRTCGLVAGTLYPETQLVVTEVESYKVAVKDNIKVLCTSNPDAFKWEYVNAEQLDEEILDNSVLGGFEMGFSLYIGKTFHEDEWKIGKVFPSESRYRGLRVWYNSGTVYLAKDFEILMYK